MHTYKRTMYTTTVYIYKRTLAFNPLGGSGANVQTMFHKRYNRSSDYNTAQCHTVNMYPVNAYM